MNQYIPDSDIYTIDANYFQAKFAAIHLIRSGERVAIVDTGSAHSITQVEQALKQLNLDYSNVDYIILTHIHLDHAGGAGKLMQLCSNAQLIVHPKGARHMAEPQRLIDGATAVYGEEKFAELYGNILPINKTRIVVPEDGETIPLANRSLTFTDTPGHANHHHCIIDSQTNSIFTGDTFGVGYHALRNDEQAYVQISSSPVQFNPDAMHASIDKIMSYQPDCLYLTHYSAVRPNTTMVASLHEQIDQFVLLTHHCANDDQSVFETTLEQALFEHTLQQCENLLGNVDRNVFENWLAMDTKLNAQGLVHWWNQQQSMT